MGKKTKKKSRSQDQPALNGACLADDELEAAIREDAISRARDLLGNLSKARTRLEAVNEQQKQLQKVASQKIDHNRRCLAEATNKLRENVAKQTKTWETEVQKARDTGLSLEVLLDLMSNLAGRFGLVQRMSVEMDIRSKFILVMCDIKEEVLCQIMELHQTSVQTLFEDLNVILRTWAQHIEEHLERPSSPIAPSDEPGIEDRLLRMEAQLRDLLRSYHHVSQASTANVTSSGSADYHELLKLPGGAFGPLSGPRGRQAYYHRSRSDSVRRLARSRNRGDLAGSVQAAQDIAFDAATREAAANQEELAALHFGSLAVNAQDWPYPVFSPQMPEHGTPAATGPSAAAASPWTTTEAPRPACWTTQPGGQQVVAVVAQGQRPTSPVPFIISS